MAAKQPLFVVVREDRHVDDEITVHSTRELADAAVEEFKRWSRTQRKTRQATDLSVVQRGRERSAAR